MNLYYKLNKQIIQNTQDIFSYEFFYYNVKRTHSLSFSFLCLNRNHRFFFPQIIYFHSQSFDLVNMRDREREREKL